ncbi:GGDEF domain-containing protein [Caballeronia ptereochthonis]|uniref:diguanylate cyclase n=1 Tax=Caballeronia ptereochthonis TaxID=1777144 RepID=A0A158C1L7_9BURK|nr:diguanylate cyclase [Caballeronia ptereochthonis]SAK76141.1 diguanylate cyclase [Caballeronia ptereochthonis]
MHVDLITIYLLAIGTLLASCGMTLWERRTHPRRKRELGTLAAGYATLAVGCATVPIRHDLPGVTGSALSNLVIVTGYLLILRGVAVMNGRQYRALSVGILLGLALAWVIAGTRREVPMWNYVSAIPIAAACGMASRELLRSDGAKRAQAKDIAAVVSGGHALFYAARACILPWVATSFGPGMLSAIAKFTVYEGVLYSVILPMTLLRLVRDEAHGELLKESRTDYLTGLGNRRWFFEEGARIVRINEASRPVALLALDLDNFKTINDRYGHDAGDEVLKSFARIANDVLGPEAMFARIGGEEFAAVLPDHDRVRAKAMGEAVAARFAQTISHGAGGVEIRATVSIGLAQSGAEAATLTDLLAAADRALYSAKSLGGNRVELAQSAPPPPMALDGVACGS